MRWLSRELGHRDVVGDGDDIPIITIISMLLFFFFNSFSHDNRKTANPYAVTITIVRKRRKKRPRFWEVPIDLCRR